MSSDLRRGAQVDSFHVVKSDAASTPLGLPDDAPVNATAPLPSELPPPKPKSKRQKLDRPIPLPGTFKSARLRERHEQRKETARAEGSGPEAMSGPQSSTAAHTTAAKLSKGGEKRKG